MSAQNVKKSNKKIIGLTGNIASGKSTALKMIQSLGFFTIDSDDIVRNLWEEHDFIAHVSTVFDLDLSKKDIKDDFVKRLFQEDTLRKQLENIIHPRVFDVIETSIQNHEETIVIDMPLLFEVSYEKHCDAVILIVIDEKTQMHRLLSRGLSEAEARLRIKAQMPQQEKMLKTSYHIDGTLNEQTFKTTIDKTLKEIVQDETI